MQVMIVGGGTMGREIAKALPDHEITVIEKNKSVCERVAYELKELKCTAVEGDGTLPHVIEKAGFDDADIVVAVTDMDEANLLIGLHARKHGKQVFVRVKQPEYIELFEELGLERIISPERRAAMDIANDIVWK